MMMCAPRIYRDGAVEEQHDVSGSGYVTPGAIYSTHVYLIRLYSV